jgi:K+-transporting ATPase ATPase C chain
MPKQANGSLIYQNGKVIGSSLIGQGFDDPKYLWGRISAASPQYNASSSSGSNIGPSNPALLDEVNGRIKDLKAADPDNKNLIPVDLVTSSASGLDPHISIAAAYYQAPRIARLRKIPENEIIDIIKKNTQGRFLGIIGEPVVNVLAVNIDLDKYVK